MTPDTASLEPTDLNPLVSHQGPLQPYLLKLLSAPLAILGTCKAIHYCETTTESKIQRIILFFIGFLHLKPGLTRIW